MATPSSALPPPSFPPPTSSPASSTTVVKCPCTKQPFSLAGACQAISKQSCNSTLVILGGFVCVFVGAIGLRIFNKKNPIFFRTFISRHFTKTPKEWNLLQYVYDHAIEGDAESVLNTIDEYCWKSPDFYMNIGDDKGVILDQHLDKLNPKKCLELGAYCGYSAVRIARKLKANGGKLYSIEINPVFASIANQIITFAGLAGTATVLVGTATTKLPTFKDEREFSTFDFVFLDHWKDCYLPDAKLLINGGYLDNGCCLFADNVIYPGTPEYLAFIRTHPNFTSKLYESNLEYTKHAKDGVEVSIYSL